MPAPNWTQEQVKDFEVWKQWDQKGRRREDLQPVLERLNPLIYRKMEPFKTLPHMPQSAVKAEFQRHAVKAVENYDPSRGVPVGHHAMRQMDAAKRFIYDYQNTARIPGHRARKVGDFKHAYSKIEQRTKRPPTALELADELKWPVPEVSRMTKELREDLLPWKGGGAQDAFTISTPREMEVLQLIPYELDDLQRGVFEFTYGQGGKPVLGTGDTAKAMNLSQSKVSRLKGEIARKMQGYLEGA